MHKDFVAGGIAYEFIVRNGTYRGMRQLDGVNYKITLQATRGGWHYTVETNGAALSRMGGNTAHECGEMASDALMSLHDARMSRRVL